MDQTSLKLEILYFKAHNCCLRRWITAFWFSTFPLVESNNYCKFERDPCINKNVISKTSLNW